jgi:hypothetical protein
MTPSALAKVASRPTFRGVVVSLATELSSRTLDRVVDGVGAREVLGADGGPFLDAQGESATGLLRVFRAPTGAKVVATTLSVPARGVVTCMVFAFAAPDSALPHFTLDCADRPDGHAFHLDLLPRVELATNVPYMDEVFEPLSPVYDAASALPGLSATGTTRRQFAMMSPWMLVHLADEASFRGIDDAVDAYADRWVELQAAGLTDSVARSVDGLDLAGRDAAVLANLFSPSVDPVWGRVSAMVGDEAAATIRGELQSGAA